MVLGFPFSNVFKPLSQRVPILLSTLSRVLPKLTQSSLSISVFNNTGTDHKNWHHHVKMKDQDGCTFTSFRSASGVAGSDRISSGFENLQWDNFSLSHLPVDNSGRTEPRPVPNAVYARIKPTPLQNPQLVALSPDALNLIGLTIDKISEVDISQVFSGNRLLIGSDPSAHCYCGHQFGSFAGQLGDGAAILLGEVKSPDSETSWRWSLQLKGSGLTPFSRKADGRKVLRSSIREFLCSEHLDALGIPTTRAGCIVTSDSRVVRDIHYSGNPIQERCSVVLRIAKTFIRFGSFEIFKSRDSETGRAGPSVGRSDILTGLANFVVFTLYPHLVKGMDENLYLWGRTSEHPVRLSPSIYYKWFQEILERTARLVAQWQCVGWCHGVLNTDNMSIIGDTIDYGPYGFMEIYDPHFVCNASDNTGRYSYIRQPEACRWNCLKLGEALSPLIDMNIDEIEGHLKKHYDEVFDHTYVEIMRNKLGFLNGRYDDDRQLINELFEAMRLTAADFTTTFRLLCKISVDYDLISHEITLPSLSNVIEELLTSLGSVDDLERSSSVGGIGNYERLSELVDHFVSNPLPLVLRQALGVLNHTLEMWKDKAAFGYQIESVLKKNESKQLHDKKIWEMWFTKFANRLILDAKLDLDLPTFHKRRKEVMLKSNPTVILRNHLAQKAIDFADEDDFSIIRRFVDILRRPYDSNHKQEDIERGHTQLIVT